MSSTNSDANAAPVIPTVPTTPVDLSESKVAKASMRKTARFAETPKPVLEPAFTEMRQLSKPTQVSIIDTEVPHTNLLKICQLRMIFPSQKWGLVHIWQIMPLMKKQNVSKKKLD